MLAIELKTDMVTTVEIDGVVGIPNGKEIIEQKDEIATKEILETEGDIIPEIGEMDREIIMVEIKKIGITDQIVDIRTGKVTQVVITIEDVQMKVLRGSTTEYMTIEGDTELILWIKIEEMEELVLTERVIEEIEQTNIEETTHMKIEDTKQMGKEDMNDLVIEDNQRKKRTMMR